MKVTKQIRRQARQLFRLCSVNGSLDEGRIRQVVASVIQAKGRGYLALLAEFTRRVRLARAERTAEVATAVPLPADLRNMVQSRLEKTYGRDLLIQYAERPQLIGGMRVQVGSDVYDGTVLAELLKLEESL